MDKLEAETLKESITHALHFQKLVYHFISGFIYFGGIGLLLVILFAPTKPEEVPIRNIMIGVDIIFFTTATWLLRYADSMRKKVFSLLFETPEKISDVKHVVAKSKGITAHGIHLLTEDNKTVGFNVPTQAKADHILKLIKAHIKK